MIFHETYLPGAYVIEIEPLRDERGFFARSFCSRTFEEKGLNPRFVQCNISFNGTKGTLRGMHYQLPPKAETKLVRCTRGAVYDAIIDLRPDSPTYCNWFGVELTAQNHLLLYVPVGFAHGFETLEDASEVFYQTGEEYAPELARGVRYNDPLFGIDWPIEVTVIHKRDATYPDFKR